MRKQTPSRAAITLICSSLALGACSSVTLWPFGGGTQERSRTPTDATEYACAAGKRFYVRSLPGGKSVWLILPERELRLDQVAGGSGTRYGNGATTLDLDGATATLNDGPLTAFTGCKSGSTEGAKGG